MTEDKYSSLWAQSKENTKTGCYEWQGCVNHKGYGRISVAGVTVKTHIHAYELCHGEGSIKDGEQIRHKCDNVKCWNPKHLLTGTNQDNSDDKAKHGSLSEVQRAGVEALIREWPS